ncbi:acid-shock protein [Methylomonas koyamae]|uniref:acid-shock protein n=1 Tax=Methylomonas koyamae TaxID=702114 RepID=UPI0011269541|nr:acid-shock protein [Methylomonas koyamae]TPQ24743.1 acid-shock protein [Methylomonas koyamae]
MKKHYIYLLLALASIFVLPVYSSKADIIASPEFVKQHDDEVARTPQEHKAAAERHRKTAEYHKGMAAHHDSLSMEHMKHGHQDLSTRHANIAKHHSELDKEHTATALIHDDHAAKANMSK